MEEERLKGQNSIAGRLRINVCKQAGRIYELKLIVKAIYRSSTKLKASW